MKKIDKTKATGWMDNDRKFTIKKFKGFLNIVWKIGKQNKILFYSLIIVTAINAIFTTILPLITNQMINQLQNNTTSSFLGLTMHYYSWFYVLLIAFVLLIILEYFTNLTIGLFAGKVEIAERNRILFSMVDQDVQFFFKNTSGEILARLASDTQGLSLGIQQFLTNIIYAFFGFISAIVLLFVCNLYLFAWISFIYTIVVLAIAVLIFVYYRRNMVIAFDTKRKIDAYITDRISNISLIKTSAMEDEEYRQISNQNKNYNNKAKKVVQWTAILSLWITIGTSFLSTFLIIIVVIQIQNNSNLDIINGLFLALPYVTIMTFSIVMIVPTLRTATRATNSSQRIEQLLEIKPSIVSNKNANLIKEIKEITFEKVDFYYPNTNKEKVVSNFNFTFEKGKSYAFVGESGCGKTTIGKLLLRFYDSTAGKITINGTDELKDLNLNNYLSNVGFVEQEPQILFGDFLENIKYGVFDATDQEVINACKKAKLHDFISGLEFGYHTILGQRGFLLSGGQKQRLVIARLFLKNPSLIILDEATSALDNIVEKEIQAELDILIKGRMSIVIAHRLSTIKNVDNIIVLSKSAEIIQQGTWAELIKADGKFKKLYQAGGIKGEE